MEMKTVTRRAFGIWMGLCVTLAPAWAQGPADSLVAGTTRDTLRVRDASMLRIATSIQALLDGSLPEDFVVQTLFEVDLLDEAAVERRREALRQSIAQRESELQAADSLRSIEIAARNRVDRLRLQFLSRSVAERARVNEAEKRRRELAREQEVAARSRLNAEARAQEAETERRRAVAESQREQSAVFEDLAHEMVRVQTARASLARLEADLAQARESQAEHAKRVLNEVWELDARLQGASAKTEGAQIFDLAVEKQQRAFRLLRQALATWSAPSSVPDTRPDENLMATLGDSSVAERVDAIRAAYAELGSAAARTRDIERDVRWQALQYESEHVRILNALRIRAFDSLPAARRGAVLGIGRAGLAQMRLEATHLTLSARAYVASRLRNLDRIPVALRDVFKLGSAFYVLLRVALVVGAALLVRRHWKQIFAAAQQALMRNAHDFRDARRVRSIVGMLRAAAPWILVLLALWVLRRALGAAGHWPEFVVLLRIATWYAGYRLTVSVLHTSVVRVATHYFPELRPTTTLALLHSLRRILGVVFGIGVLLDVSEILLGAGYLHQLVVGVAGLVVFFTILAVLHGWRHEIADAYLRVVPAGRLAAAVQRTRNLWFGFSVGIVAFVWLAGRALVVVGRDFALGFDQVRRALAFLFRRRMEKRAEQRGYASGDIEKLPPALVEQFVEDPVGDANLVVDHFPGMQEFESNLAQWRETGSGGQFLLIGERGMGKSSWLRRVNGSEGLGVVRCQLDERVWTPRALAQDLQSRLLPEGASAPRIADLQRALLDGEPRLIVLDMCQNLFLSMVGGYEGLEAFSELMNETSSNVFWLCACNSHAWRHVEAVRPDLVLFQYRQALGRWSEEAIHELIDKRVRASGVEVNFQDLVLDRLDPGTAENRLEGAEEAYIRLLWDHSDGNPRAALHYWLRSLEPEGDGRVRARLFRAPSTERLEAMNEVAQFILAAVVTHENLTVPETAATTRYPHKLCRMHLNRFVEHEILVIEEGRYRLSTHWHRTAVRFLSRKNLLAD